MHENPLVRSLEGPLARLTLNDPEHANVLSSAMLAALQDGLAEAVARDEIRVVVIAATGRVFSAGHDLAELRQSDDLIVNEALFARCSALMQAIGEAPKPVIAKVSGAAVAAGCQLVAACDLAYAGSAARFAVSGVNLGLFCSTPSVPLTRKVGPGPAAEMLFTGAFIDAAEACRIGLVNRVVAPEALDRTVDDVAATLAAKPAEVLALGKAFLRRQSGMTLSEAYAAANRTMAENLALASAQSGIDVFLSERAAAAKRRAAG